ncbi:MAG: SGNH/GDSL hydrolase family protein [Acidobacteriota bacterium]
MFVALLLVPTLCGAAPITALYVVGDSLSDQGNGFILTGGFPPPPYDKRASNGPVAVEQLASVLGVSLTPSEQGGTNFAVIGATTGVVPNPNAPPAIVDNVLGLPALVGHSLMAQAVEIALAGPIANPNETLFVVWGGANDLSLNPSVGGAVTAINNLAATIGALFGAGARRFLVPNLPDLSQTPAGLSVPLLQPALFALTTAFDSGLATMLNGLPILLPGIQVTPFNTFGFLSAVLASPAAYGFSNVTDPCLNIAALTVCSNPDSYLFWDTEHPTAAGHQALGNALAAAVQPAAQPVPEPATLMLVGLGLAAAFLVQRRVA